jgi:hypothetical protein
MSSMEKDSESEAVGERLSDKTGLSEREEHPSAVACWQSFRGIGIYTLAGGTRRRKGLFRPQTHVLVLLVLVIGIWYLVFRNHSVIHAGSMVRLLVWPLTATAGMVIVAVSEVAHTTFQGCRI